MVTTQVCVERASVTTRLEEITLSVGRRRPFYFHGSFVILPVY